jgi:rod shape-determining protein MreD
MRKSSSAAGLAVLFVVLVALHYSLRPLLAWRAAIDFLLIGVMLVSVRVRPGSAAVVGLLAGLVADALAPSAFGAAAIAMCAVGFAASWLKAAFFAENVMLNGLFLFVGKLAFDALFLLAERRVTGLPVLLQLGVWSVLSAVVTAFAGLALLLLFRPLVDVEGQRA